MSATTTDEATLLPVAMRDTARTVKSLAKESLPFAALRVECDGQIERLREALNMRGLPRDVIDDALYAQCALLDETALKHLTGSARDAWEHEPLQLAYFASNDAGDELIRRIENRLREPRPSKPLLVIFAAVLALGFVGRFAVEPSTARATLARAIDERLGHAAADDAVTASAMSIVLNHAGVRGRRISPFVWMTAACIAAGLIWLVADRWFVASIAALTQ